MGSPRVSPSAGRVRSEVFSPGLSSAVGSLHLLRLAAVRGIDRSGVLSTGSPHDSDQQSDRRAPSAVLPRTAAHCARAARRSFRLLVATTPGDYITCRFHRGD